MKIKANIVNRYFAGAVDFGIAIVIYLVLTNNLKINFIAFSIFILSRDCFAGGKSIGKMLFNLKIQKQQDGTPATYRESILRNFFFVIPIINILMIIIELFLIYQDIDGSRIGDKIALTQVIDDETKLNNDINGIFIKTPDKNNENQT